MRPKHECVSFYKRRRITLIDSQVCAGGVENKDSCVGDSGGPLMVLDITNTEHNYIAYGIVSIGPRNCGMKNSPSVYTRVADYIDWIRNHLQP